MVRYDPGAHACFLVDETGLAACASQLLCRSQVPGSLAADPRDSRASAYALVWGARPWAF